MDKKSKTGIALGGGAVLGAAHIGVLKAVEEANIKIDYITGTSIGSLVATLYAFDIEIKEIEEIAKNLSWNNITKPTLSKYGLLSNKNLKSLIHNAIGNRNIEEAKIPLAMIATDISNGERVVLNSGSVSDSVMASTCIPGIFKPVEIEEKMLIDGGIVENVPVESLKNIGAEYVIGVDLNPVHTYGKPNNIVDVILNSFHYSIKQTVKFQLNNADLLIQPDLSSFNLSNTNQISSLIEKGYQDTKQILANL